MSSRAFPYGNDVVVEAAIKTHKECFQLKHSPPAEILDHMRKFATQWANRNLTKPIVLHGSLSSSACLEATRKQGGNFSRLRETYSAVEDDINTDMGPDFRARMEQLKATHPDVPECTIDTALREYHVLIKALMTSGLLQDEIPPPVPVARVQCIKERGFKAHRD
jgi:hypothetical protein